MNDDPLPIDVFVALSSALTGISATQLAPDATGVTFQYLATLKANVDAPFLVSLATTFQSQPDPNQAVAAILADPVLSLIARSIIKLWLMGSWYPPLSPTRASNVVSAQAYKESLVWKIMQSHPMGYSMFEFGYWSKPPPAFSAFIQLNPAATGGSSNG